ncbi:MAG: (2Fe-2S)-binding protein [Bacteroidetes bacterium]|nr:(2Fe-2S)-binding protein [Bacteroidota bacterium]
MKIDLEFTLNGKNVSIETEPGKRLLDLLRKDFKLTGTKEGCSIGECGACTILLDKLAVNSCLILAGQINGSDIITIEGINEADVLHTLQQKFLEHGAVQCGFCTPGMIISAYALLLEKPDPSYEDILNALEGNLCRCTGYKQIISAVQDSAKEMMQD